MTIVHVVILKFHRPLLAREASSLVEAAYAMKSVIPVIKSIKCGCDLGLNEIARSSYSLTAEFSSIDDYKTYSAHPAHVEFINRYLKPYLAVDGRRAIQFEI